MKLALITDTHFGVRGDNKLFQDNFEKFYENVFFPTLEDQNIKNVVHLGDAFDRRKYTNHLTLQRARDCFYGPLDELDIYLTAIVGNHDAFYKDRLTPSTIGLHVHMLYDHVDLIDRPTWRKFDGLNVALIPWICDENRDDTYSVLADRQEKARVVMGHLELKGFEMYRGMPSDEGYDVTPFLRFEKVFSGHFHHRHTRNNITYLGCPYEITWSDCGDPKGFHVFDTETLETVFCPNPYTMFVKGIYEEGAERMLRPDDVEGRYVRLSVKSRTDGEAFWAYVKELEKAAISVQVIDTGMDKVVAEDEATEVETTPQLIHRYIDQANPKVDHDRLKSLMDQLYHEALN